jgi:exonuclease V
MVSGIQSLLDLGMCREMPVVGFINGVLILGIIVNYSRHQAELGD